MALINVSNLEIALTPLPLSALKSPLAKCLDSCFKTFKFVSVIRYSALTELKLGKQRVNLAKIVLLYATSCGMHLVIQLKDFGFCHLTNSILKQLFAVMVHITV